MKKYFMVILLLATAFIFQSIAGAEGPFKPGFGPYEDEMKLAKSARLYMKERPISGKIQGDWNRGTFKQTLTLTVKLTPSVWDRRIKLWILPNDSEDGEKLFEITMPASSTVLYDGQMVFNQSDLERIARAGEYRRGSSRFMTKVTIVVWIMVGDPGKYGSWVNCSRIDDGWPCYIPYVLRDIPVNNTDESSR